MNVWQEVNKPIMCLAPMEGVTDTVFRRVVNKCGRPDLSFTEFTSVDGMYSKGYEFVAVRLEYEKEERPLIAQIWGLKPDNFYKAGNKMVEMGFDGVDLNMGCPDKDVIKKGAGGALVKDMKLAQKLVLATKMGVGGRIPVSVKIRTGFEEVSNEWVRFLLDLGIDALTLHGRTVKQKSKVAADWNEIGKAVAVRNEMGVGTKIIGNGDVLSLDEAQEKVIKFGVDGVMVGRGIFQDPWLFNPVESYEDKSPQEKLELLLMHAKLFDDKWRKVKSFHVMRKYIKIYVNGFYGAKELRIQLMEAENRGEVEELVAKYLK